MRAIFDLDKKLDYYTEEAMNGFRINLSFCGQDKKVILLTSYDEGEGKSSTCMNLAKTEALNGKKTLLIDADMRKSVLAGGMDIQTDGQATYGLSHYLSGQVGMEKIFCKTNIDALDLIFAGPVPPNPSGLLDNEEFQHLLAVARREYELVIVDCPPLGKVIDAAVVAKYADGAIMLVEVCEDSYHALVDMKKQIELSGCEILGVVLNKMPKQGTSYYKKYYGGYYSKYGKYGKYGKEYGSYGK